MPVTTPLMAYQLDHPGCSGIAYGPYLSMHEPYDIEHELPTRGISTVCMCLLPAFNRYELLLDIKVPFNRWAFLLRAGLTPEIWLPG